MLSYLQGNPRSRVAHPGLCQSKHMGPSGTHLEHRGNHRCRRLCLVDLGRKGVRFLH